MDGAWFCVVTMSTVGYGDKAPRTGVGKALTLFWMIFGIINFGVFTGTVIAVIALARAEGAITGPESLTGLHVGVYRQAAALRLHETLRFQPVYCDGMAHCASILLSFSPPRRPRVRCPGAEAEAQARTLGSWSTDACASRASSVLLPLSALRNSSRGSHAHTPPATPPHVRAHPPPHDRPCRPPCNAAARSALTTLSITGAARG